MAYMDAWQGKDARENLIGATANCDRSQCLLPIIEQGIRVSGDQETCSVRRRLVVGTLQWVSATAYGTRILDHGILGMTWDSSTATLNRLLVRHLRVSQSLPPNIVASIGHDCGL